MNQGRVEAIYTALEAGGPMIAHESIRAIPGQGLQGDRYTRSEGTWSQRSPDRDLTLMDTLALQRLSNVYGIRLGPGEHRRNVETSGIDLGKLIGKYFTIGDVRLLGIRVCNPCAYLVELTGHQGLLKGMLNSGLFVRIVTEGTIEIGHPIVPEEE